MTVAEGWWAGEFNIEADRDGGWSIRSTVGDTPDELGIFDVSELEHLYVLIQRALKAEGSSLVPTLAAYERDGTKVDVADWPVFYDPTITSVEEI